MSEKNVIEFYVLCNRLKDVVRTGWKIWGAERNRVESVAEHVYGTQMLAVAMWSEFSYDIDLMKVLSMLAVHELEETLIGDLTPFDIDRQAKIDRGHRAIDDILHSLLHGVTIKDLIMEFDDRKTKEAQFAYYCDKLEAGLQCKLYDEEHCFDINKRLNNAAQNNADVRRRIDEDGCLSIPWLKYWQEKCGYDDNFKSVSEYAANNNISKKGV